MTNLILPVNHMIIIICHKTASMPSLGDYIKDGEENTDIESYTCSLCKAHKPSTSFQKIYLKGGYRRNKSHCSTCPNRPNAKPIQKRPNLQTLQNQINTLQNENEEIKNTLADMVKIMKSRFEREDDTLGPGSTLEAQSTQPSTIAEE